MLGNDVIKGSTLAVLAFVMVFSSLSTLTVPAAAQGANPLFSVTLLAPNSNPVRREYAAIISQSLQSVGINAHLVYVTFASLDARIFPENLDILGKSFDQGGFDIAFIGFGQVSPTVDFLSQYHSGILGFPPNGNNYKLWNSTEADRILDAYGKSLDPDKQADLMHQLSKLLYAQKPDLPIYWGLGGPGIAAVRPGLSDYGVPGLFRELTYADVEHWSGKDTLTMAETGDVSDFNPLLTEPSNTAYDFFLYGGGATVGPLAIDTRDYHYYNNLAESVTHSDDGLTWTVKLRQGIKFHDGVGLTADDLVYAYWLEMNPDVTSLNYGFFIDKIGSKVDFTFVNGTTVTVDNTETGKTATLGSVKALDKYTYEIKLHDIYFAAYQFVVGGIPGVPKHLLEQIKPGDIDSHPFSTARSCYSYTWDVAKYGGSGSYTACGPVTANPYVFKGYDYTARIGTLERFDDYWNATGLKSIGQFTVKTYKVVVLVEKEAALAAYANGEVDLLDPNYSLNRDVGTLQSLGAHVEIYQDLGWQEMGFNMRHPLLGTGVDTPLGKSDPSKAAEAARHVRQAISYLIPRQLITSRLLLVPTEPASVSLGPWAGKLYDPSTKGDPFDPELAKKELAAAGYNVGSIASPIEITPPAPQATLLFGSPVQLGGKFLNPSTGGPYANFLLFIQQSLDNKTWTSVQAAVTASDGTYSFVATPPVAGAVFYRVNFTGATVPPTTFGSRRTVGEYAGLLANGTLPLVLPSFLSPTTQVTTTTLADILKPFASAQGLDQLSKTAATKDDVATVSKQIDDLRGQISTLTTGLYGAIALIVIVGAAGFFFARRRK